MSYNEFVSDIMNLVQECPKNWRKGQSVFNIVDAKYGVARTCQFEYNIDCFYDDNQIDSFLKKSFDLIQTIEKDEQHESKVS